MADSSLYMYTFVTPARNILKVRTVWVQNWWFCCYRCPSRMCTGTVVARVNCEPSSDYAVINLKNSRRSHLGASDRHHCREICVWAPWLEHSTGRWNPFGSIPPTPPSPAPWHFSNSAEHTSNAFPPVAIATTEFATAGRALVARVVHTDKNRYAISSTAWVGVCVCVCVRETSKSA